MRPLHTVGLVTLLVLSGAACSGGGSGSPDGSGRAGSGGGGNAGSTGGGGVAGSMGRDGGSDALRTNCPGPPIANWKADGSPFVAFTVGFGTVGPVWQLTIAECVDDGVDRVLEFGNLPTPVAVGSYMLTNKLLHGAQTTTAPGAVWMSGTSAAINAPTNFYTDSTHTGTFTVTSVDMAAMKFSATFSFTAVNDAATGTVNITEGVITNEPFQM